MNVADALRNAEQRLRTGPHPERARLDSETLFMHATGKNRAWLLTHGKEEFGGCTAARFGALVERRQRGEPIQYITGECEFYGLPFRVTPAVLIPRPETEHLVEAAIEIANRKNFMRIVDVGTGSGAIAVALARALPKAAITAVDISEEALTIARHNAERNNANVRFLKADLLDHPDIGPVSLVVSNPPYVARSDAETLSVEVRDHEPHLALFAEDDGLSIYRRLIAQASHVLAPSGRILLELGYGQSDAVREILQADGFSDVTFLHDLQGISRVAQALRPGN